MQGWMSSRCSEGQPEPGATIRGPASEAQLLIVRTARISLPCYTLWARALVRKRTASLLHDTLYVNFPPYDI
jgi:hypothetical protein